MLFSGHYSALDPIELLLTHVPTGARVDRVDACVAYASSVRSAGS